VPLCRTHHRELHRNGDEVTWWQSRNIDPIPLALKLWRERRFRMQCFGLRHNVPACGASLRKNSCKMDSRCRASRLRYGMISWLTSFLLRENVDDAQPATACPTTGSSMTKRPPLRMYLQIDRSLTPLLVATVEKYSCGVHADEAGSPCYHYLNAWPQIVLLRSNGLVRYDAVRRDLQNRSVNLERSPRFFRSSRRHL
jgi:hypothetical protein